jgi:hypothetical protein
MTDITVKRLDSGYYRVSGAGPCEWTQPPEWPCDEAMLRAHAFPEASESFLRRAAELARAEVGS